MSGVLLFAVLAAALTSISVLGLLRSPSHEQSHRARRATNLGLAVVVPAAACALYASLGNFDALLPPAPDPVMAMAEAKTAQLASRLATQDDDVAGMRLLARSYEQLKRFREAAAIRARLVALLPDDAEALDDLAETLAMPQGGSYVGEPIALVGRALALEPTNDRALAMAANDAAQRDDLPSAIAYWERMLPRAPADSAIGRALRVDIDRAKEALTAAPAPAAGSDERAGAGRT